MSKIVFLDIDGVLGNFTKAGCKQFNIVYPSKYRFNNDTWLYDQIGGNKGLFWSKIRGHDFWSKEVEPYPWAKSLINVVDQYADDWVFCSKPSADEGCYSGKYEWVKTHLKKSNRLWLCNGSKALAAGPNKILIDDKEKNCLEWAQAGGEYFHWEEISDDFDKAEIDLRLTAIAKILVT